MNRIAVYPAILDDRENQPGQYTVTFPDVPAAIADGNSLAEALVNAECALGLVLYDVASLPPATPIDQVEAANPGTLVNYIYSDLTKAAAEVHRPMVKKNTRIPAALAAEAEAQGINFSATLSQALKEKLGHT